MSVSTDNLWNTELINRYDLSGPRYTSYPTAMQFSDKLGGKEWVQAVAHSNQRAAPLSFYFHIPFCDTVCFYCACNRIITANKKVTQPYIQNLLHEIELQSNFIDRSRPVKQMHWGGGTPTFASDEDIAEVIKKISDNFVFCFDEGEFSIEIHPASVDAKRMHNLRKMGFNRISMGIQDFDPQVQAAVNRFNSVAEVERLMKAIRQSQYQSVSMDLIYGLPHQNVASFAKTIDTVIALQPNRLSLFNYAHMPERFKTQQKIAFNALPEPQEKLAILQRSIEQLSAAGYIYIGMDHFALPGDELTIAQTNGQLQRNFQGYSTHKECDLFAFGVSSISSIGGAFFQNFKGLENYQHCLELDRLPIEKGVYLSDDDHIRRDVINDLICNFKLHFEKINSTFAIDCKDYFKSELEDLKPMQSDGLLEVDDRGIVIRTQGRMLVRRICMVFDKYISNDQNIPQQKYSRII